MVNTESVKISAKVLPLILGILKNLPYNFLMSLLSIYLRSHKWLLVHTHRVNVSRTFIGAKWYGFVDPQSGLDRYVWWAGNTVGGSEVLPPQEVHLTEVASAVNLSAQLPVGQRIYVTVRAYNKAGESPSSHRINVFNVCFMSCSNFLLTWKCHHCW
jgi:hypothetical protein